MRRVDIRGVVVEVEVSVEVLVASSYIVIQITSRTGAQHTLL